ncbi:MAG: zinc-dependent metalloprotease, partial [Saprospiraceae bacterium]|nr:zinc-dependent metalloprotease [Saprospiraceae bacterium]
PETIGNGPWASEVEKTDFSNCYNSGDYFCDTRPDYLNYRWNCDGNGESIVTQHDPNGVPFKSDGKLIMGYSSDACGAVFTEEQIAAMRSNLHTEHASYLQVTEPALPIDPEASVHLTFPVDSQAVQYNDFTLHWDPVPNATFYTVDVSLINNSSFQPRLLTKTVYNATSLMVSGGLPNNRTLFWRVRPYSEWDLCKSTAPQQIGIFKTKDFSATNDLEASVYAELSPNPVNAGYPAQLSLTADDNLEAVLTVIDAAGRKCQEQQVRLSFGENLVEIPTDGLQSGLYIISLQNEKGTILKRLAVAQ